MLPPEPPSFATYLVSSLTTLPRPFRKRHSSTPSTSSTSSTATAPTIFSLATSFGSLNTSPSTSPTSLTSPSSFSRSPESYDTNPDTDPTQTYKLHCARPDHLKCSTCATDLAFASQIISKAFTGRHGRAYLVSPPPSPHGADKNTQPSLINITVGRPMSRQLATGAHVVADISCAICEKVVGWKYVDAREEGQKYKVGKFILEMRRVAVVKGWEDMVVERGRGGEMGKGDAMEREGEGEDVMFDSEDEDECDEIFAGTWDRVAVRRRRARAASG
ncbi:hypothetical protein VF21_00272 [Pseudogymnoascus sp. 05NY08]|nr:hypothetical protein VF21_00023 [Pseudogymnoascus sp. 05NY08]OBT81025.1 hypothetical protein VF21_00272 [Pseudogymnoascus sp. 05NY08]